jgi:hypothetical protein
MNRTRRLGLLGALAVIAAAATPFAVLWAQMAQYASEPTAQARLDLAIWLTVFATPAMFAAWLLWRAW